MFRAVKTLIFVLCLFVVGWAEATVTLSCTKPVNKSTVTSPFVVACSAKGGSAITHWNITLDGASALTASNVSSINTAISASAGTHSLTIKAQDLNGASATIKDTITVSSPSPVPLQITTTTLPSATVGSSCSTTLQATGGTSPYSWSVASGSLPSGMTLSTGGTVSGNPTAAGQSTFTVQATDSATSPQAAMATLTLMVTAPAAPPRCDYVVEFADGDRGHRFQHDPDGIRRD